MALDAAISGVDLGGMFPRVFQNDYIEFVRGDGPYLWDAAGEQYIDATAGSHNANIGHGVSEIADAAAEQMERLEFVRTEYVSQAPMEFTSKVAEFTPDGFEHAWIVSGGSLAVESAIKMAYQYHFERGRRRKHKVISRRNSYHGATLGALAATGYEPYARIFEPLLLEFPQVPEGAPYRCEYCDGDGGEECGVRCADAVEEAIRDAGPRNVAAFIAEPVSGTGNPGARPHDGYFERVREICDEYDVLFVADEIMTGFGRTGTNFAVERWDVDPDLILAGKGMSAGYAPMGGVMPSKKVVDVFEDAQHGFWHGHTNTFNPTSAAVGLAVLEYVEDNDVVANARRVGDYLGDRLRELSEHRIVGDVRGVGMQWGVEFVKDSETERPLDESGDEFSALFVDACHDAGLVARWNGAHIDGRRGDATLVTPPLVCSREVVDEMVDRFEEAITTVQPALNQ